MRYQWSRFEALSPLQLHRLLQLRAAVFVVEQQCIYLDPDDYDTRAWHLLAWEGDSLVACLRALPPGEKYAEASIGRVATGTACRGRGIGRALFAEGLRRLENELPAGSRAIRISAQGYLKAFYSDFGFEVCSAPYDEDGIPHVEMLRHSGEKSER